MPKVIFGSSDSNSRGWAILLDSPRQTYTASRDAEIIPLINLLESEARSGAWVALFISYEAAPAFDPHLRTHSTEGFPLLWAGVFDGPSRVPQPKVGSYELIPWEPRISRDDYTTAIGSIRELIATGDTYQVNYTFAMSTTFRGDSLAWYWDLCAAQRADYCVYAEFERYIVLSISPELFFQRTGDEMLTRPMKGTCKRGRWSDEDEAFAKTLAHSSKQRAENVMIVDLLRNDLGKISVPGSVEVSELFQVERYPTLWQMTSAVKSKLKPETALTDVFKALFPCGSITGAPKIRTMQIINELEPFPRDVYTGAIGLIKPGGDCIFNVAIRTVLLDSETGEATFGVGSGITYSSSADNEYEECLLKTTFLSAQLPKRELLESILLEDGEYFLLNEHIARLQASARYFAIGYDEHSIMDCLENLKSRYKAGRWKVRMVLSQSGEIECQAMPLEVETVEVVRVGLADEPVDSNDVALYHKLTTNLAKYRKSLARHPEWEDVILWNERGEITESSVANIVVRIRDRFVTPALTSGLLPGTFRELLLRDGQITEAVVAIEELRRADEFYLINSVRKWRTARLFEAFAEESSIFPCSKFRN